MKTKIKVIIFIALVIVFLLALAPWITEEYAINKVNERFGPDTQVFYYNKIITVKEVPKHTVWIPFGRLVAIPEKSTPIIRHTAIPIRGSRFVVTFYGSVLP